MSLPLLLVVAGLLLLSLGFARREHRLRSATLRPLAYGPRTLALLAGLCALGPGIGLSDGWIGWRTNPGAPDPLAEAALPRFDPLLPLYGPPAPRAPVRLASDDEFAGFSGTYALAWVGADRIYHAEARFSGAYGTLRVTYDVETGTRMVDEALVLRRHGVIWVYEGVEPRIAGTPAAAPEYTPDVFYVLRDGRGWSIAQRCDEAWNCAPVGVRALK